MSDISKINFQGTTYDIVDSTALKDEDDAVATSNIEDSAITNAKLAASAVSTANIADNSITVAKLASDVGTMIDNKIANTLGGILNGNY